MNTLSLHDLDIELYNFDELLGLFGLSYDITITDIKRAKKIVLMTHPDKSKLSPKYFLFYKRAYDILHTFYENQNKQDIEISNTNTDYEPMQTSELNESSKTHIKSQINNKSQKEFHREFNHLFDEHMAIKPDTTKNEWFYSTEPSYDIQDNVNVSNMKQSFDNIKDTQTGIVRYNGVSNLYMNSGTASSNIYGDDNDEYVSCDTFGKLKYDDLRKVHKEQSIFLVSERDLKNIPQYSSTDHLIKERGKVNMSPLSNLESERLLSTQNSQYKEQMMRKAYTDKLKTDNYADKNRSILSRFLRLT
jgi:hypothetical protein